MLTLVIPIEFISPDVGKQVKLIMKKIIQSIVLIIPLILLSSCEKEPEARSSVLEFVQALRIDKDFSLDKYLDIDELVRENSANVYLYDSTKSISENKEDFEELFQREGKIRKLWTSKQIVIGESVERGDTALVEVSFIDRQTKKQYYNKMGLKKTDSGWKIFAFKLL
jgi:hypothetical protein